MSDIKTTTESAADSVSRAAEAAKNDPVDPAKVALENAVNRGEEFAKRQGERLEDWIVREPLAAVGAAFGLGVLVTLLVRVKID